MCDRVVCDAFSCIDTLVAILSHYLWTLLVWSLSSFRSFVVNYVCNHKLHCMSDSPVLSCIFSKLLWTNNYFPAFFPKLLWTNNFLSTYFKTKHKLYCRSGTADTSWTAILCCILQNYWDRNNSSNNYLWARYCAARIWKLCFWDCNTPIILHVRDSRH